MSNLSMFAAQSASGSSRYQFALPYARKHPRLRKLYSAAHHKYAILQTIATLTRQLNAADSPIPDWLNQTTLLRESSHMMATVNSMLESKAQYAVDWRKGKKGKARKRAAKAWYRSEYRTCLKNGTVPTGWEEVLLEEDLKALRARAPRPNEDDMDGDFNLRADETEEDEREPTEEETEQARAMEDLRLKIALQHQGQQRSPAAKGNKRSATVAAGEENGALLLNFYFMHYLCYWWTK